MPRETSRRRTLALVGAALATAGGCSRLRASTGTASSTEGSPTTTDPSSTDPSTPTEPPRIDVSPLVVPRGEAGTLTFVVRDVTRLEITSEDLLSDALGYADATLSPPPLRTAERSPPVWYWAAPRTVEGALPVSTAVYGPGSYTYTVVAANAAGTRRVEGAVTVRARRTAGTDAPRDG